MKEKFIQFTKKHEEGINSCINWILGSMVGAGITMIILSDYRERDYNAGYTEGTKIGLMTGVTLTADYYRNKESSDNNKK